ncbi:MAG: iron ABC transporter permease [Clostridia bacterium]
MKRREKLALLALVAATLAVMLVSVGQGAMPITASDTARILLSPLSGQAPSAFAANQVAVVWEIRLPRILASFLVGAGLSVAGVIFQSLLGNPLADPYTLGVSTGAAFGASLAILLNLLYGLAIPVTPPAFGMAMAALVLVLALAQRRGDLAASNLVIAGMIVSAVLSSAISFMKMLAGENVSAIVQWMMGSLSAKNWDELALLFPIVLASTVVAASFAGELNLMNFGERAARALGVNVRRTRLVLLLAGALVTAGCVSVSGVIGFVGLIVPHMLRMAGARDNRALVPLSALGGGLLLLVADNCARLLGNGDIPVGILTTLIGGPFFLYLFMRRGGHGLC